MRSMGVTCLQTIEYQEEWSAVLYRPTGTEHDGLFGTLFTWTPIGFTVVLVGNPH